MRPAVDEKRQKFKGFVTWAGAALCYAAQRRGERHLHQQHDLIAKLDQIEEQARLTLAEFPKNLTKERQRMIIALVRAVRFELAHTPAAPLESEQLRSIS